MTENHDHKELIKNQADRERGERLNKLRTFAGLTVVNLAKLADVNRVTLSYWQSGSPFGLSSKGAQKIIDALKTRNIECTFEWLWEGVGNGPRFITYQQHNTNLENASLQVDTLFSTQDEIDLFMKVNKDAVIAKIDTGKLHPSFEFNDVVAGTWQPLSTLRSDSFCIIELDGVKLVRWIKIKNHGNGQVTATYSYSPFDDESEVAKIDRVAPIIRLWR